MSTSWQGSGGWCLDTVTGLRTFVSGDSEGKEKGRGRVRVRGCVSVQGMYKVAAEKPP